MLHLVRSVAGSWGVRSAGPSAGERLTELLAPAGGWLPPAVDGAGSGLRESTSTQRLDDPSDEPSQRWLDDPSDEPSERWLDEPLGQRPGPPDELPDERLDELLDERPDPADDGSAARSWAAAGRHVSREPARRWRLELGRAAVGGLLVVAAVAALVAGGVVLRGRPQEVAAPVVDATNELGAPAAQRRPADDGDQAPTVEVTGVPLPGSSPAGRGPAPGEVVVAVAGKVRHPGLVRLPAGSRVDDAVRAAGGPVDPAATGLLNLARVLVDGEQVLVGVEPPPGSPPAAGPAAAGSGAVAGGGPVDLNVATAGDLDALPGIGPVLAQRIVDWRTANGRFASVDQLREVAGIGEAKYQELVARVVV